MGQREVLTVHAFSVLSCSWRQTLFHTYTFKTVTSKMLEARTEVQSLFLAARDPGANTGWDLKVLQCKTNMAARYDRTRWTNIHHLGTRRVPSENFLAAAEKTHNKCQYCLISQCMTEESLERESMFWHCPWFARERRVLHEIFQFPRKFNLKHLRFQGHAY